MSRRGSFGIPSEISRSATNIGYGDKSSNEKLAFKPTFGSQRSAINAHNYYSISGINGMQEDDDVVDDDSDGDIFVPNGATTFSDYSRENSSVSHVPYTASVSVMSADGTGDREEVSVDDLQSDVQSRLVAMEKRIHLQEEEICILKSALSNALTRIQALEQGKPAMNTTILPSRPPYKSTPKMAHPAVQRSYDSGGGPKKAQSMDVMVSAGANKLTESSSPAPAPSRSSDYPPPLHSILGWHGDVITR